MHTMRARRMAMRVRAAATTVALAACLAACALPEILPPKPIVLPDGARRVATASTLGDRFTVIFLGMASTPLTAFGDRRYAAAVPDWAIDRSTEQSAADLLASQGRFAAAPLPRAVGGVLPPDAITRAALLGQASQQHADLLVLVRPNENEAAFVQAPVGLYERASPIERDQRCVYSMFVVEVVDVASGKSIGSSRGAPTPCEFGHDDDLVARAGFDDFTSGERLAMQQRVARRTVQGLRVAFERLGLLKPIAP